ncbi:putative SnoaL-like aldol condensation-catalyzing enzyme [Rhizobium sp. BK226]|uniref:nuclear transport factor 2 family protein n=1 Tax=Rhizobium sp. BK226 TaxID=2587075 RepID=UPI00161595E1|nr:nuclear transport factor 2 family protein [Rhizobium sp. BK226]MBB4116503.1 putative SnoaL-like aldol condensation-catalyzing enzyme [Rhizobium sp. BK226]
MNRLLAVLLISPIGAFPAASQEAVTAKANADALFTSPDPKLHANKQVVYHIVKDLLEANHWELADRYISDGYVQHNPNARNGREAIVKFFIEFLKVQPKPLPEKLSLPVSEVIAEGDLVTVIYPREVKGPNKTYTTAWFDTWRIADGKAIEHWDPSLLNEPTSLTK